MSTFTHSQFVSKLHEFLSSVEHKRSYFEEVTKQSMDPIDFVCTYYGSQWVSSTVWLPDIIQNILFCVQHKKERVWKQIESI